MVGDTDVETGALLRAISAAPASDTASLRAVRRAVSAAWAKAPAAAVIAVASDLHRRRLHRWIGFELIRHHKAAFSAVNDALLAQFTEGLDSWDVVDAFARILSGPAWVAGRASDGLIDEWSRSPDRWKRRAALVSTVALNSPGDGGQGDADRTLAVCGRLADDRDDMVEKALSWALRALAKPCPAAVVGFMAANDDRLAARVRREVGAKLRTGLKNPRGGSGPRGLV
jgi:3-methyladenine DNA glycosylase AlkD